MNWTRIWRDNNHENKMQWTLLKNYVLQDFSFIQEPMHSAHFVRLERWTQMYNENSNRQNPLYLQRSKHIRNGNIHTILSFQFIIMNILLIFWLVARARIESWILFY